MIYIHDVPKFINLTGVHPCARSQGEGGGPEEAGGAARGREGVQAAGEATGPGGAQEHARGGTGMDVNTYTTNLVSTRAVCCWRCLLLVLVPDVLADVGARFRGKHEA